MNWKQFLLVFSILYFIAISPAAAGQSYYSMPITITNNPNIANYEASTTIAYQTGMSSTFANIRFYDNGVEIPYWVETYTASSSATVWIPISTGSNIQCRWGITGETASESNATAIFRFFDHFDNLNSWTGDTSYGACYNSYLYYNTSLSAWKRMNTTSSWEAPLVLEGKWRYQGATTTGKGSAVRLRSYDLLKYSDWYYCDGSNTLRHVPNSVNTNSDTTENRYTLKLGTNSSTALKNGAAMTGSPLTGDTVTGNTFSLWMESIGGTSYGIIADWIAIRKYAATTPTLTANTSAISPPSVNIAISWSNPSMITYGTALSSTQLNAEAAVPGTFTYSPASGTILSAGTQVLHVDFVPNDQVTYNNASANASLFINTVSSTVTWGSPSPLEYGTALSGTQLNATANTAGTFNYLPASGSVLPVGTHTLYVFFYPTDSTNYTLGYTTVSITVTQGSGNQLGGNGSTPGWNTSTTFIQPFDSTSAANITGGFSTWDYDSVMAESIVPFTDLMGKSFYVILFILPFAVAYMLTGSLTIPSTLALIFGSIFIGLVPESYKIVIIMSIVISFGYNLYKLSVGRE